MNFLRRSNQFCPIHTIIHLSNHDLEFGDSILIDFAEIINEFDYLKASKGGDSGGILGLNDCIVAYQVVSEEGTVDKVCPVRNANPTYINTYVIYFSLASLY
jgi:hypothetical protein